MKTKVIQQFTAIIALEKKHDKGNSYYTVEFDDKGLFNSTLYILQTIEEKFGEVYNAEFIKDLKQAIELTQLSKKIFVQLTWNESL